MGSESSAEAAPLSAANRTIVGGTVTQAMKTDRLPGVTITLSGPSGSYRKAYGHATTRTRAPMGLGLHVRIASITKTFTATAILRQVQRGRLPLSGKLIRWVRGIPNGNRITVRELLAMRSGIYSSDPAFNRAFDANPRLPFKPTDVIPIIRRHKPLFAPGARTQYADSNYVLLGIILRKVTGRPAESVITSDVIPAGLRHTSFPTVAAMPKPYAHAYYAGPNTTGRLRDYTKLNPKVAWTAGGMVSTLGDLQKWGKALATGALLSHRLQAQRLRFGAIPNGAGPPVGYVLGILRLGDWLGHDGAIFGFSTETFYDRHTGAQISAVADLSSNFSTPTLAIFATIAGELYPSSLNPT